MWSIVMKIVRLFLQNVPASDIWVYLQGNTCEQKHLLNVTPNKLSLEVVINCWLLNVVVLTESWVIWLHCCTEERTGHTKPHLTWVQSAFLLNSWMLLGLGTTFPPFWTEWILKTPNLDVFFFAVRALWKAYFLELYNFCGDSFLKGNWLQTTMDQASGGEDPNKPSKKKSNEDEGKNKKLVGI